LSKLAVENGAELWTNTELIDLEYNVENYVTKATVKRNKKLIEIIPKILIAADGVESTVLKLLGLYNPKRGDLAEVYSWEMKNLNLFKPHFEQIFTGSFTPSGYAYIFPKSKDKANIGVGGIFPEKKLDNYFEEFLEIDFVKKQIKNANFVIEKSKKAVWNDLSDKWIHGNVLLVGDAANQNLKPFIEGILPSVICGDIVGKIAFDFITKNNVDNKYYLNKVKEAFDKHFEISKELQDLIGYLFTKKGNEKYLQFFGIVTELLKGKDIEATENMDYEKLKSKLLDIKNEM
jgi:digeranylgeranylglycerophospholipid reductase